MRSNVMYEAKILGRTVNYIWAKFGPKRDRAYARGWHGAFTVYLDDHANRKVRVEYHAPVARCGLSVDVGGEDAFLLHVGLPPASVFVAVDGPEAQTIAKRLIALEPSDMGWEYGGRRLALRVFDWAVWWDLWVDDSGWTRSRPKWRDGSWHPLGSFRRRGDAEILEERSALVPMPERSYKGKATLTRERFGFSRLPALFDRIVYGVKIDMAEGEQIPHPGKGENSYDCGEDATYGFSCPAQSIEEGIGHLASSVLRSRRRHGGPAWRPAAAKATSGAGAAP